MFGKTGSFNQPAGSWATSAVSGMEACLGLRSASSSPFDNLDTPRVADASDIFADTSEPDVAIGRRQTSWSGSSEWRGQVRSSGGLLRHGNQRSARSAICNQQSAISSQISAKRWHRTSWPRWPRAQSNVPLSFQRRGQRLRAASLPRWPRARCD